jgi:heme a synthase
MKTTSYQRLGILTIIAVYFLIWVGGVVRSTGSGMGCPDWPKCFGQYIPPTDISQLPPDYKLRFAVQGKEIADFDPLKTWIEYINRLVGVLIGFFILLTAAFSIPIFRRDKVVTWLSVLAFLLVGFQGWLGSVVVSTDLHEGMITLHMLVALLIVGILIYAVARDRSAQYPSDSQIDRSHYAKIRNILLLCLVLNLIQVTLGTQVREAVDMVAKQLGESLRHEWIDRLGISFYVHRSFSLLVLAAHGYLLYLLYGSSSSSANRATQWLFGLVVLATLTGVIMAYGSIPAFLQPIHLLLGSLIFGVQIWIGVRMWYGRG